MSEKHQFLLEVPNDPEGVFFFHLLDKFLNKGTYSIRKRARGPRAEAAKKDGLSPRAYDSYLPVKHATYFQLYLEPSSNVVLELNLKNQKIWELTQEIKHLKIKLDDSKLERIRNILAE